MSLKKTESYGLHWFRRDLRLEGNSILQQSLKQHHGKVLTVFCFDRAFLARPDFSWNRFLFFLRTLDHLRNQIESLGGSLIFLDQGPREAFPELIQKLEKANGKPSRITWNRDYEPFALKRDADLEMVFRDRFGIETESDRDHLLIEPNELLKESGASGSPFYQVFTPFKKKWLALFATSEFQQRIVRVQSGLRDHPVRFSLLAPEVFLETQDVLQEYIKQAESKVTVPIPPVGFERALKQATFFGEKKILSYEEARDIPSVAGTSQLSIYFKNGSITVPQVIALLLMKKNGPSAVKFFDELIWREFYYHILTHFPYVEKGCFIQKYDQLKWENDSALFEAWREGKTGYPIVDAGMRQLNQTGWMHNRVRMIVASFLMKDLLVDWKWGEKYFMEKLLDGDLAPNNGGWQWAASTGCDPQPYFRIFNPTLQAERFDENAKYILKWVPELAKRPDGLRIYEPYRPVVIHAEQKAKVLKIFQEARDVRE